MQEIFGSKMGGTWQPGGCGRWEPGEWRQRVRPASLAWAELHLLFPIGVCSDLKWLQASLILLAWGNTVRSLGFSWITLYLLFFPSRKRQYYLIGLSFSCLVNSTQQIDLHSKRSTYYLAEKLFVGFGAHKLDGDGLRGSPQSWGGFPLGLVGGKWNSYLRILERVYFFCQWRQWIGLIIFYISPYFLSAKVLIT